MNAEQFCYWLQGRAELDETPPTPEQWKSICEHLATVFVKVTPPVGDNNLLKPSKGFFDDLARQYPPNYHFPPDHKYPDFPKFPTITCTSTKGDGGPLDNIFIC